MGYDKKILTMKKTNNKRKFISDCLKDKNYECLWDIGCNNGYFSKLIKKFSTVIAFDFDHEVMTIYIYQKKIIIQILIHLLLTNPSPVQGWNNNCNRNQRSKPNFVLCLAFIHHARFVCNIPQIKLLVGSQI